MDGTTSCGRQHGGTGNQSIKQWMGKNGCELNGHAILILKREVPTIAGGAICSARISIGSTSGSVRKPSATAQAAEIVSV